jgi:hypothetical protein
MRDGTLVRMSGRLLLCAFILIELVCISASFADNADAEELFRAGRRLMKEGRFADACIAFENSNRIERNVNTLANLGDCWEKSGRIASAWKTFVEVIELTKADPGQENLRNVASTRAQALESRVSFVTLRVTAELAAIDQLEILIDGQALPPSFWNTGRAVDGGTHEVRVSAPGYIVRSLPIQIEPERDIREIILPGLERELVTTQAVAVPSNENPQPRPREVAGVNASVSWTSFSGAGRMRVRVAAHARVTRLNEGCEGTCPHWFASPDVQVIARRPGIRNDIQAGVALGFSKYGQRHSGPNEYVEQLWYICFTAGWFHRLPPARRLYAGLVLGAGIGGVQQSLRESDNSLTPLFSTGDIPVFEVSPTVGYFLDRGERFAVTAMVIGTSLGALALSAGVGAAVF